MSGDPKMRCFTFVGSAMRDVYMEAAEMVNDRTSDCSRDSPIPPRITQTVTD
jgi:3-methyladenine DNA glycosylase Tag